MPLDGYLWLEGVRGEAKHHRYTDWLSVQELEWGLRQNIRLRMGVPMPGPVADIDAFTFHHPLDRASVRLFEACLVGRNLPEITFVVLQPDPTGDTQRERMRIQFRNCLVAAVEVFSEGAAVTEKVEVVFGKIDIDARERTI